MSGFRTVADCQDCRAVQPNLCDTHAALWRSRWSRTGTLRALLGDAVREAERLDRQLQSATMTEVLALARRTLAALELVETAEKST